MGRYSGRAEFGPLLRAVTIMCNRGLYFGKFPTTHLPPPPPGGEILKREKYKGGKLKGKGENRTDEVKVKMENRKIDLKWRINRDVSRDVENIIFSGVRKG